MIHGPVLLRRREYKRYLKFFCTPSSPAGAMRKDAAGSALTAAVT